jgi:hypothetical protein
MRASVTTVASAAIPLAALLSLTACRGVVVAAAPPSATATTAATSNSLASAAPAASVSPATVSPATVSPATPAPGELIVSMTSPVSQTWTADGAVTCARTALLYLASADGSNSAGYNESLAARVAPFRGPGTYPALVTLTVTGPQGGIASVSGVPASAATITSTGGTFTIDHTGADGRTLDATVSWTCP